MNSVEKEKRLRAAHTEGRITDVELEQALTTLQGDIPQETSESIARINAALRNNEHAEVMAIMEMNLEQDVRSANQASAKLLGAMDKTWGDRTRG